MSTTNPASAPIGQADTGEQVEPTAAQIAAFGMVGSSQLGAYASKAQALLLAKGMIFNVAGSGAPVNILCDGTSATRADLGLLALFGQQTPAGTKTWLDNNGVATTLTGAQLVTLATLAGTWIDDTYTMLATVMGEIAGGTITTTAAIDSAFAGVTN